MERNIALRVAYDGTAYRGWQIQSGRSEEHLTIQYIMSHAIAQVCNHPIRLLAAGRTDSGVHARGMVCNFFTTSAIPLENVRRALNVNLPRDIRVMDAREMPADFHSRFSASIKTYCYTIEHGTPVPDPLTERFAWHLYHNLDRASIERELQVLVGEHDFACFRGRRPTTLGTVRVLTELSVHDLSPTQLAIRIRGKGFLKHMVRSIVGTVVDIQTGRFPRTMTEVLAGKQRALAGRTAPAAGLLLESVEYVDYVWE
ncbi:tRNA pseudouridine(38-40) synthase TruA [Chrysiogenes arsenatis]|uniref:tRNA pseudouridine(38-40) synthase TruA n=1 Tax=Chrysiogenes arsenatis TaxID=309797 RepID=UPI0004284CED|nr:tRNA pseudouridine(38-40) synthase TruA [Chrysiogenes arsenatis]